MASARAGHFHEMIVLSFRSAPRTSIITALLAVGSMICAPAAHAQQQTVPYEAGFEGEIWRTLPAIGGPPACFDFVNFVYTPGCTPAPGADELLYPVDVALFQTGTLGADGFPTNKNNYRIYVTDSFNNRVVTFKPAAAGGWTPLSVPDAEWTAPNLSFPDHLTVDGAGNVLVSDYNNRRIAIFDADEGELDATISVRRANGTQLFVYGISVTPGTVWGQQGTIAVNGIDFASGINVLAFYNAATGALRLRYEAPVGDAVAGSLQLATGLSYDASGDHLIVADYGNARIVVFDVDANGVIVDANAADGTIPGTTTPTTTPVLVFGRPTDFGNLQEGDLQSPFSVTSDSRGRIIVSDTENQRLAIFQPTYPESGPASATFLFKLDGRGNLNGFPRGVTEDAVGRILVVDTANHEVMVFEIPDVAVVDVVVIGPRSHAPDLLRPDGIVSGSFLAGDRIKLEFNVIVPATGSQIANVIPGCSATDPTGLLTPTVAPAIVGRSTGALHSTLGSSGEIPLVRPVPTDVYRIRCEYTARQEGLVTFATSVTGDGAPTSNARSVSAQVGCPLCETGVPTIGGGIGDPLPVRQFYNVPVRIDLSATDAIDLAHPEDPRAALPPTGISKVYYQWVHGPLVMNDPNFVPCAEFPGTRIQCVVPPNPASTYVSPTTFDVSLTLTGTGYNVLEYWAADGVGNRTARQRVTVGFDTRAPFPLFDFPPSASCWTNAGVTNCWYAGDISVPINVLDDWTPSSQVQVSGASSPLVFNQDGANPSASVTLTDLAGNGGTYSSSDPLYNGRVAWIDRVPPVTTLTCTRTAPGGGVSDCSAGGTSSGGTVSISLSATDALSGVRETRYILNGGNESTFTGTPLSPAGSVNLTYWSIDVAGGVETQRQFSLFVNRPPVAVNDTFSMSEDVPATFNVLANDSDPDGQVLQVTIVTGPTLGQVTVNADRTVTFTPNANVFGSDSFTYRVDDGAGGTATATVTVTIVGSADPPVATAHTPTLAEDGSVSFDLLAGASDPDNDTVFLDSIPTSPANGTLTLVGSVATYRPREHFNGQDTFTYRVTDRKGGFTTATVTLTVTAVNDPPVVPPQTAATDEDTAVAVNLLAGAVDVDGDTLTVTGTSTPANGQVARTGATATYTPNLNFFGIDSFTFTVTDGTVTVTSTVTITVREVNDLPVAVPDSATVLAGVATVIPVLANDSDVDGDVLRIASTTTPAHGLIVLSGDGRTLTYTANAGYAGPDSFDYTVSDGRGGLATATVSITVRSGLNRPPVCGNAVARPLLIFPPNFRMVDVEVRNVRDPEGDPVTIRIDRILQDEPTATNRFGSTWIDGGGIGSSTARVRAERVGRGDGRIYEIQFTATDPAGESCTGTVFTGVPKGLRLPKDSGCRWDSTVPNGPTLYCYVTEHLVDADIPACGYSQFFAAEGRIGGSNTFEMALGANTAGPAVTAEFDWRKRRREPFVLTYDGSTLVFKLGFGRRQQTLSWNVATPATINTFLLRAHADRRDRVELENLFLNGLPLSAEANAPHDGSAADIVRIVREQPNGFSLVGTVRFNWRGNPRNGEVAFQILTGRTTGCLVPPGGTGDQGEDDDEGEDDDPDDEDEDDDEDDDDRGNRGNRNDDDDRGNRGNRNDDDDRRNRGNRNDDDDNDRRRRGGSSSSSSGASATGVVPPVTTPTTPAPTTPAPPVNLGTPTTPSSTGSGQGSGGSSPAASSTPPAASSIGPVSSTPSTTGGTPTSTSNTPTSAGSTPTTTGSTTPSTSPSTTGGGSTTPTTLGTTPTTSGSTGQGAGQGQNASQGQGQIQSQGQSQGQGQGQGQTVTPNNPATDLLQMLSLPPTTGAGGGAPATGGGQGGATPPAAGGEGGGSGPARDAPARQQSGGDPDAAGSGNPSEQPSTEPGETTQPGETEGERGTEPPQNEDGKGSPEDPADDVPETKDDGDRNEQDESRDESDDESDEKKSDEKKSDKDKDKDDDESDDDDDDDDDDEKKKDKKDDKKKKKDQ